MPAPKVRVTFSLPEMVALNNNMRALKMISLRLCGVGGRGATFYSVGKIAKKNSATSSQIFSCYPRSLLVARFFCATHVHCQNE